MQKKNSKNKITCPVEILRKFSFGIASTYLFAILFGLFLPFNYSFGQSPSSRLVISAEKLNIKAEESLLILAKTYNLGNKLVTFKVSPNQGLSIGSCTTGEVGSDYISSCQTTLKTTKDANGTFLITASINYNGTLNSANKIELKIEKGLTTIVCKEPQILNEKKDACITPPVTTPPNTLPGGNNAGTSSTAKDTDVIYEPLAPLPGDGGVLQTEINTQEECAFGKYLNIIIKLIIGISAVLAMIMITMGGIEYMTSELVSEKSAGKDTIQNAILGLLIALGSYLILNTINPQLLNVCLDKLPTAEITIEDESETTPETEYFDAKTPTQNCKDGYTNIDTGNSPRYINVCKSFYFSYNLNNLIQAAKKENIILSGFGSRNTAKQIKLRKEHGCPDIYNSPAEKCKPPTAKPGYSMHESGLAVDFTCNGKSIMESGGKNSICFKWLSNNASKFYIKNYGKEPWHWSYNGR